MDIVSYAEAAAAHKTAKSKKQYIIAEESERPDITTLSEGDSWFNKTTGLEMVVIGGVYVEASGGGVTVAAESSVGGEELYFVSNQAANKIMAERDFVEGKTTVYLSPVTGAASMMNLFIEDGSIPSFVDKVVVVNRDPNSGVYVQEQSPVVLHNRQSTEGQSTTVLTRLGPNEWSLSTDAPRIRAVGASTYTSTPIPDVKLPTNTVVLGPGAGLNQGQRPNDSVMMGSAAGSGMNAASSVVVGSHAGFNSTSGDSSLVGYRAGYSSDGDKVVAVGVRAAENSNADYLVAVGTNAGQNSQGTDKVAVGQNAGMQATGANQILMGGYSGVIASGDNLIALGDRSGYDHDGDNSIGIGSYTNYFFGNSLNYSNTLVLGHGTQAVPNNPTKSNQAVIGNSGITETILRGNVIVDGITASNLPTSKPEEAGRVWNDGGMLVIGDPPQVGGTAPGSTITIKNFDGAIRKLTPSDFPDESAIYQGRGASLASGFENVMRIKTFSTVSLNMNIPYRYTAFYQQATQNDPKALSVTYEVAIGGMPAWQLTASFVDNNGVWEDVAAETGAFAILTDVYEFGYAANTALDVYTLLQTDLDNATKTAGLISGAQLAGLVSGSPEILKDWTDFTGTSLDLLEGLPSNINRDGLVIEISNIETTFPSAGSSGAVRGDLTFQNDGSQSGAQKTYTSAFTSSGKILNGVTNIFAYQYSSVSINAVINLTYLEVDSNNYVSANLQSTVVSGDQYDRCISSDSRATVSATHRGTGLKLLLIMPNNFTCKYRVTRPNNT